MSEKLQNNTEAEDIKTPQASTKLFLDDVRKAPDDTWLVARTADEFMEMYLEHKPDKVSLDHDLAAEHYTGQSYNRTAIKDGTYVAKWINEQDHKPELILIHSMNFAGSQRMHVILETTGGHPNTHIIDYKLLCRIVV